MHVYRGFLQVWRFSTVNKKFFLKRLALRFGGFIFKKNKTFTKEFWRFIFLTNQRKELSTVARRQFLARELCWW